MFLSVIFHAVVIAFDGVTIDASVEATFISAYVDTFNAIADIPLIFVFFGKEGVAGDSFDQFFVDTQSGRDSQMSQINFGGAGIQLDSRIFVDGIPERDGYFFNLLFSQRLYVELADCGADMLVMVNKSQHTLFGMVFKSIGNLGKRLLMERNVIFLVGQYRVIAPDHFFFSYFIRKAFEYVYSFVD